MKILEKTEVDGCDVRTTHWLADRETDGQTSDTDIQNMYLFLTEDRSTEVIQVTWRPAKLLGGFCRSVRVRRDRVKLRSEELPDC